MVLVVRSDALYLNELKARSQGGGHFFLSSDTENPINNGAVLNIVQLIKAVMSSAAEAELGALYINACEAVPQRQTLAEMGHNSPQLPCKPTTVQPFLAPGNYQLLWTKHHCAAHHIKKRPEILTPKIVLNTLCASVKRTPDSKTTAQPTQTTRVATAT